MSSTSKLQVIVLGMHRSGTSLVANIISTADVQMGEQLMPSHATNVDGFYEDETLVDLNDEVLASVGCSWERPASYRQIGNLSERFADKFRDYVQQRDAMSVTWGVKDPRLTLTIQLMHPYLDNPRYVICRRDREQVAKSLHARGDGHLTFQGYLDLISDYENALDAFFAEHPELPRYDVDYADLQNNTRVVVTSLFRFLGLEASDEALDQAIGKVRTPESLRKAKIELLKPERDLLIRKAFTNPLRLLTWPYWRRIIALYRKTRVQSTK